MEGTKEIIHTVLLSLSAGIGKISEGEDSQFIEGKDCLNSLKDLKRILKQDFYSNHRNVFFLLSEWNFVDKSLIPAFLHHFDKIEVSKLILEILVPLTWQLDQDNLDKMKWASYLKSLKDIKKSFEKTEFWKKIALLMGQSLQKDEDGGKDGKGILQLCTCLIRNLSCIKDPNDFSLKSLDEDLRETWLRYHIFDLTNDISGSLIDSEKYAEWKTVLLGSYHGILCNHPLDHFFPGEKAKKGSTNEIDALLEQENEFLSSTVNRTRHSKFIGNYNLIIDGRTMQVGADGRISEKSKKNLAFRRRINCNATPHGTPIDRKSALVLRKIMKEFIETAFNGLSGSLQHSIDRQSTIITEKDTIKYLQLTSSVLSFFVRYSMEKNQSDFHSIAVPLNLNFIHFLTQSLNTFFVEKNWEGVEATTSCIKSMICVIGYMGSKPEHEKYAQKLRKIFYHDIPTLRTIQFLTRSPFRYTLEYFGQIIDLNASLITMMESYLAIEETNTLVPEKLAIDDNNDNSGDELKKLDEIDSYCEDLKGLDLLKFKMGYANEENIQNILKLLRSVDVLETKYIVSGTRMLQMLFIDLQQCKPLFYKLSFLMHINYILQVTENSKKVSSRQEITELKEILSMIVRDFMLKLKDYPMMFVEILFSKNSHDCKHIELGEDPIQKSLSDPMEEMKITLCVDPLITELREKLSIVATRLVQKSQGFMLDWAVQKLRDLSMTDSDEFVNVIPENLEERRTLRDRVFSLFLRLCGCKAPSVGHGFWQFPCSNPNIEVIMQVSSEVILQPYVSADGTQVKDLIIRETKKVQMDFEMMEQENYLHRYRNNQESSDVEDDVEDDEEDNDDDNVVKVGLNGSDIENHHSETRVKGFEAYMKELRAQNEIIRSNNLKEKAKNKKRTRKSKDVESGSVTRKKKDKKNDESNNDDGDDGDSVDSNASVYSSDSDDSKSNGSEEEPLFDERGEYVNYETLRPSQKTIIESAHKKDIDKDEKDIDKDEKDIDKDIDIDKDEKDIDKDIDIDKEKRLKLLDLLRNNRKFKEIDSKPQEGIKKRNVKMIMSDDDEEDDDD